MGIVVHRADVRVIVDDAVSPTADLRPVRLMVIDRGHDGLGMLHALLSSEALMKPWECMIP